MAYFTQADINAMDNSYRVNFINSLSGFKSANLIGTTSNQQQSNLAIISSVFHLGANPALIGFINRPHCVDRHTLENILQTGCYTLNHVHEHIIEQAHQTSARYPREQSEFKQTGLEELWLEPFSAPFVKQSYVHIGLNYKEHHTLLNDTVLVIGEVDCVGIPDQSLQDDGLVDMNTTGTTAISGLDTYHLPKKIKRMAYAKPDKPPSVIEP